MRKIYWMLEKLKFIHLLYLLFFFVLRAEVGFCLTLEEIASQTEGRQEEAFQVAGAKVLIADYGAIKNYLGLPKDYPKKSINQLLIRCCA